VIVTFTANPSVDRTSEISALVRGAVIRAARTRVDGGGKGVNVTRALAANGHPSIAVLPCGGAEGAQLMSLLEAEDLLVRPVPVAGAIRANVTIVEPDGTTTKINEPGPTLSDDEVGQLADALLQAAKGADWAVLSGSLPPGAPADLYATLTGRLHRHGVRVAVDTDGTGLAATFAVGPDVVKPNQRELAQASGMAVVNRAHAIAAVDRLRAVGAHRACEQGADGALLVDDSGGYHGTAEVRAHRSTVGAGDAMLAGFLAAGGSVAEALAEAVAWGTAAVSLPGSRMPGPTDLDRDAVKTTRLNTEDVAHEHAHYA
jgi:1-phosphofructokinase